MSSKRRNSKQVGTNLYDCKPQVNLCHKDCNQCFYNHMGEEHNDVVNQIIPDPKTVGDGIVRVNALHDSNIGRDLVIKTALMYDKFFFNTSIPLFDFPGPVVFTANSKEEEPPSLLRKMPENLMFVRLRTSVTNIDYVANAVSHYTRYGVPVVITFMRYYKLPENFNSQNIYYDYNIFIDNRSWCPTRYFKKNTMLRMKNLSGRLVSMCGSFDSNYCRDCMNCEGYYYITMKHMREVGFNNE